MKKALFIMNPASGKGQIKNYLFEAIDKITRSGYYVTVYPTQCRGDATRIVIEEGSKYDLLICSGGDGTLDEVVVGHMSCKCNAPIGYIPAGSTNDYAKSLEIPTNISSAIANIVSGSPFAVDVGHFLNTDEADLENVGTAKHFIYVAAIGAFSDLSYSTDQHFKNMFGHAAYIMNAIANLNKAFTPIEATVRYDDKEITDNFILGLVTNSMSVGGLKNILINDSVVFDDGLFECLLVRDPGSKLAMLDIVSKLNSNNTDHPCIESFKTSKISFSFTKPIPWALDGEFGGSHKQVTISNLQQAVKIIV